MAESQHKLPLGLQRPDTPEPGAEGDFTTMAGGEPRTSTTIRAAGEIAPTLGGGGPLTTIDGGEQAIAIRGANWSAPGGEKETATRGATPGGGIPLTTAPGEEQETATRRATPGGGVPTTTVSALTTTVGGVPTTTVSALTTTVGGVPTTTVRALTTIWRRLKVVVLTEDTVAPSRFADFVDGALGGHTGGDVDALWIHATMRRDINAARIAEWLRAAAARVTGEFCLSLAPSRGQRQSVIVIQVPQFQRATSLVLWRVDPEIALP